MSAIIYQITNQINGKSYIGFTTRKIKRITEHKHCDGTSPKLDNAVKKYGWENFNHQILYMGEDEQHTLKIIEPFFIQHLNTKHPNGYNLTNGGDGILGYKHTKETRRKISIGHKGQIPWIKGKKITRSSEYRKKLSLSKMGENNPNYGKSTWNKGLKYKYKNQNHLIIL